MIFGFFHPAQTSLRGGIIERSENFPRSLAAALNLAAVGRSASAAPTTPGRAGRCR